MVSIIPGIDARAPERTETSSGASASPKRAPTISPTRASVARTSSSSAWLSFAPAAKKPVHTSVVRVNPGGTGMPRRLISARPAPLPPSRSFMVASPSAFPEPKK